jgi:hypothetical protein
MKNSLYVITGSAIVSLIKNKTSGSRSVKNYTPSKTSPLQGDITVSIKEADWNDSVELGSAEKSKLLHVDFTKLKINSDSDRSYDPTELLKIYEDENLELYLRRYKTGFNWLMVTRGATQQAPSPNVKIKFGKNPFLGSQEGEAKFIDGSYEWRPKDVDAIQITIMPQGTRYTIAFKHDAYGLAF